MKLRTRPKTPPAATPPTAGLAAAVAPASVEVTPRMLRVGDGYAATLVVTGYPAEVGPAWLEPLLSWPGRLDLALHIDPLPAPLKLPADAVDERGEINLGATRAAIVAATSVNLALRTADEQAALIDTFGRWLNSLSTPTQIVVSAQPVDLHSHARTLAGAADRMPHPALADAAADHARFLDDLAERRDPLHRLVLIVSRTNTGERGEHAARRRADDTVRSLSGLGVTTRALDGHAATAALAAAADPYRPPRPGGLAAPDAVITATPAMTAAKKAAPKTRRKTSS